VIVVGPFRLLADERPTDRVVATTPEQLVVSLAAAADKADIEGVWRCFFKEARELEKQMFGEADKLAAAHRDLSAAMDQRFGKAKNDAGAVWRQDQSGMRGRAKSFAGARIVKKKPAGPDKTELEIEVSHDGSNGAIEKNVLTGVAVK